MSHIVTNPLQSESQKLEQLQIPIQICINKYDHLLHDSNGIVTFISNTPNTSNTSNTSLPKSPARFSQVLISPVLGDSKDYSTCKNVSKCNS